MEPAQVSILHKKSFIIAAALFAVVFLAGLVIYTLYGSSDELTFVGVNTAPITSSPEPVRPEEESFGGALYEKASNPLEEKLPEQAPLANPLEDAYKNPFE